MFFAIAWKTRATVIKDFVTDRGYGAAWAARCEGDGGYFSASGQRSDALVVSIYPPDPVNCNQTLAIAAEDASFLDGIAAIGFASVDAFPTATATTSLLRRSGTSRHDSFPRTRRLAKSSMSEFISCNQLLPY
jgi:hypothetical protein